MKKQMWNGLLMALFLAPGLALARPNWQGPREVIQAAKRVDNRANAFLQSAKEAGAFGPFVQNARRLTREADQFRQKVERGASYEQVAGEYVQLQGSFKNMSQEFERNHKAKLDWRVRYLWLRLSYSFQELDWAVTQGEGSLVLDDTDVDPDAPKPHKPHKPKP